jgi:hypothetical protein
MGVVYLATDLALERSVALKVLAEDLAKQPGFQRRFVGESKLAASLDHPNVIPIYAAGEHQGVLYIAMRFVPGHDLRTLLREEGRLEPERAARLVAQVASALDLLRQPGRRDLGSGRRQLAPRPQDVRAAVAGGPVQPRAQVLERPVLRQLPVGRRERVLERIFCLLGRAEQMAAQRQQPAVMALEDRLEGGLVTTRGHGGQLSVADAPQVRLPWREHCHLSIRVSGRQPVETVCFQPGRPAPVCRASSIKEDET